MSSDGKPSAQKEAFLASIRNADLSSSEWRRVIASRTEWTTGVLFEIEEVLLRGLLELHFAEACLCDAVSARRNAAGVRAVRKIEHERKRLAHELHTGVGQLLATIRLQREIMNRQFPDMPTGLHEGLQCIDALALQSLEILRGISRELYAPEWSKLSLDEALRQLWHTSGVSQRYTASINASPLPREPEPEIKTLIYRCAQESISNLIRHANAQRVQLSLHSTGHRLELTVSDDGSGFDAARLLNGPPATHSGIGLRALREEAADLGGRLHVSSDERGTTVRLTVPLEPSGSREANAPTA